MERILLVGDAEKMDTQAVEFACYIAAVTHSSLIGYWLHHTEEDMPVMKFTYGMPYVETVVASDMPDFATHKQIVEQNLALFNKICRNKGVKCFTSLHDSEDAVAAVLEESRFADLVLVMPGLSIDSNEDELPSHFVKMLLAGAECPVLVAPRDCTTIDEVIFAYDGSRSSVYAIKQFTYLFPELADKRITLLQVNDDKDAPLAEKEKIVNLLKMHYSGIGFRLLQGKPSDELFGYVIQQKNALVVMGACGRSWLSELVKPTRAGELLKQLQWPLFIAHQ